MKPLTRNQSTPTLYALILILALVPTLRSKSLAENLALRLSCTEEDSFLWMPLPWGSCERVLVCLGGAVIVRQCPPGMVMEQLSLLCRWPNSEDVRRCYKNMEGYARASCARDPSLVLPNPDSCALFIDCRGSQKLQTEQETDVTHSHVYECPYPDLFSPLTFRCVDFRRVQHLCHERPLPKAPCDYLQYRQIASSLQTCHRRHPSCLGMRDGFHPVALTRPLRLYVKRCFQERTIDVISCTNLSNFSSVLSNGNSTCTRHVYEVSKYEQRKIRKRAVCLRGIYEGGRGEGDGS